VLIKFNGREKAASGMVSAIAKDDGLFCDTAHERHAIHGKFQDGGK
jgi:hypothetical protein